MYRGFLLNVIFSALSKFTSLVFLIKLRYRENF